MARSYFKAQGCAGGGHAVLAMENLFDLWVQSLALRSLGLTTFSVPRSAAAEEMRLPDLRCVVSAPADVQPGLADACTKLGVPLLSPSAEHEASPNPEPSQEQYPVGGHILRTSGTTGTYKMVLMTADMDATFLRRKVQLMGMSERTVLSMCNFPVWTAAGYRWAASPWTVGGATVIDQSADPFRTLFHPGVTHAFMVPRMLASVLSAPEGSFPRLDALQLAVGGGPMTRSLVAGAKARITSDLFNFLASTEAGCIALTRQDGPEDYEWQRIAPEREIEIVDERDLPVPHGEVGRLRVSTAGGPNEYLQDESATQAFFRKGYFYPGDLGVIRADGRLALRGRFSDVLNVGGHKILPSPIEGRLCDTLGITGACLLAIQGTGGEEELHVVLEAEAPVDPDRVTAALLKEIRGLWKARVHYIKALPRNQMGKLMRRELRDLIAARTSRPSEN